MSDTRSSDPQDPQDESQQETFISHLIELRQRLVKAVAGIILVFVSLVYWAPVIFNLFSAPLMECNPDIRAQHHNSGRSQS